MDSGLIVIILIFVVALLTFLLGVYCHFCGEVGSGGRYYGSNQNIVATAVFTKRAAKAGEPTRNSCKCSKKFKGQCADCEGETFVDDGELGSPKDFSNFGGDKEFEFPGGGRTDSDAIRGLMGNGSANASAPPSALDQPDQGGGGGGGHSFGGTDQY